MQIDAEMEVAAGLQCHPSSRACHGDLDHTSGADCRTTERVSSDCRFNEGMQGDAEGMEEAAGLRCRPSSQDDLDHTTAADCKAAEGIGNGYQGDTP